MQSTPSVGLSKRSSSSNRRQSVQSAEMGMEVLKVLAALGGSSSLTAIGAAMGENTAKVHRYMVSLLNSGLVVQNEMTQHYQLGREALMIGLAAFKQSDPLRLGEASLMRLCHELELTSFIAVMGNKGPTVLRMEEPSLPVTVNMRPGSVLPILWSATGQSFLAHSKDPKLMKQAQNEHRTADLKKQKMLKNTDAIARLCEKVVKQGCALVNDLLLQGISAISAPIFDFNGHVCAVITVLGSSAGFDSRLDGWVAQSVIRESKSISFEMGFELHEN